MPARVSPQLCEGKVNVVVGKAWARPFGLPMHYPGVSHRLRVGLPNLGCPFYASKWSLLGYARAELAKMLASKEKHVSMPVRAARP